jgi:DNA mismatch repair protein MutS2
LTRQARSAADNALHEAETMRSELVVRLDKIEDERRSILEKARAEAESQVKQLQAEIISTRNALARARQPVEVVQALEEKANLLDEMVEMPVERKLAQIDHPHKRAIRLGDKVRLRTLGSQGVVSAISEGEAEVQVGVLRVRTRLVELELVGSGLKQPTDMGVAATEPPGQEQRPIEVMGDAKGATRLASILPQSPGMELDLRGRRADDALEALDRYLDSAFYAGLPFVRIIHGKGTGKLRDVVREALGENSNVKSFQSGGEKEGGDGVTVAKLAV